MLVHMFLPACYTPPEKLRPCGPLQGGLRLRVTGIFMTQAARGESEHIFLLCVILVTLGLGANWADLRMDEPEKQPPS